MTTNQFKMRAKVWRYPEPAGWHFVTLPKKQSNLIRKVFSAFKREWGTLPVSVTIGQTNWNTSIFFDAKLGSYALPLKADVRKREGINVGDTITFLIEIRV